MSMNDEDSIKGFMTEEITSRYVLTTPQLAAIGSVVVESTYLEQLIEQFIWYLAGLKGTNARKLTEKLQLTDRIELMAAFMNERLTTKEELANYELLHKQLKVLTAERNTIVHGMWHFRSGDLADFLRDQKELEPSIARKPKRGSSNESTFTADRLANTAAELYKIRTNLLEFWYSVDCLSKLS